MRTLNVSAIVLVVGLATLAIISIGLAYENGWSDGRTYLFDDRRPLLTDK